MNKNNLKGSGHSRGDFLVFTWQDWPITVAARSEALTIFVHSKAGVVGSNPT
jgi:hypothetical protein